MASLDSVASLSMRSGYLGMVTDYDEAAGLGTITLHGAHSHPERQTIGFHCTQIADGSRSIAVGTRVRFQIIRVNLGRFEASAIEVIAG